MTTIPYSETYEFVPTELPGFYKIVKVKNSYTSNSTC
jgi:hypothetical protein